MKAKAVVILMVCLFLMAAVNIACQGKQEPIPISKVGKNPPVSELTPEEIFKQAIQPMVDILEAAQPVAEGTVMADPGYELITSIKTQLMKGSTTIEQLAAGEHKDLIQGLHKNIKPEDVSQKFVDLTKDLGAGQSSDILQIPGVGYGLIHIIARNDDGTIDLAVIVVRMGPPPPTKTDSGAAGNTTTSG
jgi:hypothetical protein